MKRKMLTGVLGFAMAAVMLAGCGGAPGNESSNAGKAEANESSSAGKAEANESGSAGKTEAAGKENGLSNAKIALVLPGSIDDQSWNASNYAGAKAVEDKYGISVDIIESCAVEDFDATFTEFGEKGYGLVISAGSQFDQAIANVAPNYPNTLYTAINGVISETDNMCPVYPKEYEGSYLAGIIAGYATVNGQFATMGGADSASMNKCLDNYDAAAVKTATDRGIQGAKARRAYINSWTDIALTKSTADQMIDNGADVVHCYSNEGQSGAVQACEDKGVKYIAFAGNKNGEADCVIASAYADFTELYPWIVNALLVENVRGYTEVGLAEGVITVDMTDKCSDECKTAVEAAKQDIISGKINCKDYFSEKAR